MLFYVRNISNLIIFKNNPYQRSRDIAISCSQGCSRLCSGSSNLNIQTDQLRSFVFTTKRSKLTASKSSTYTGGSSRNSKQIYFGSSSVSDKNNLIRIYLGFRLSQLNSLAVFSLKKVSMKKSYCGIFVT